MVNFLIVGDTDDASLIVRNELIKTAWAKIAENPWTGYGLNSFRYFDYRDLYTHNNFVEVLFSGGIPLLAVYYVLNLWIIIQAIRCYKRTTNKELIATVMALEIVMIFSDIGMVSYYTKFVMIMQLFLVCIVNKCKNSEEGISEQQE